MLLASPILTRNQMKMKKVVAGVGDQAATSDDTRSDKVFRSIQTDDGWFLPFGETLWILEI